MKMVKFALALLAFGSTVLGVPLSNEVDGNNIETESDFIKSLNKCAFQLDSDGIAACATERIVRSLDGLAIKSNVEIIPGVALFSDKSSGNFRSGKQLNDDLEQVKTGKRSMVELIGNATARFLAGRTLKIQLPTTQEIGRALEEGRKRRGGSGSGGGKKGGNMNNMMMGLGAAIAGLVPLFLGKIALIAGKALIVGKIALLLSIFLLVPMLMKNNNNNNHQHQVESSWSSAPQASYGAPQNSYGAPSGQYPYSRSFSGANDDVKYSQEMAYASQRK